MKGNWGKVLLVDLGKGTLEDAEIPEKDYRDYLGGSGLAAKWFFDHQGWKADPLSPENPFMVMLGPLSGLNLPGASRLEFCARSPLTGIWGESSMGGHFAPQLKATGYDGIIFTGASDKPVYLYLTDKGAEIRDASHLWGKDTYETEEILRQEVGDKRAQVACIGPAGENMVLYAGVFNDKGSTAGRCGMGAVMGSKKLKAVVARGSLKPEVADEEALKKIRERIREALNFSLVADGLKAFGSNVHMEYGMAIGDVPTKNWRVAYWQNGPDKLAGSVVAEKRLTKNHACYGCPISCKRIVEVKTGPFSLPEGPGSEYEGAAALGTLLYMDDLDANLKANELCNRYGMDVISTGSTIAWSIEAYEKGLLTEEQTGGLRLSWNDPEMLPELIRRIAYREGLGDILAEGTRRASEKFGGKEFAIQVKGLECPMHDPRALWGMSLTYATSIRGACHCADANLYADMGLITHDELGIKRSWPFKSKGKAAQTVGSQVKSVISNSAVICEYVAVAAFCGVKDMAEMINAATGLGYDLNSLRDTADRIWYIKRAIGNLCGATRDDDQLPQRILEPHPEGITPNLTSALFPTYITMKPMGNLRNPKVHQVTANLATKYLFPNIDRLLRGLRLIPGLVGHERRLKRGDQAERARSTVPFREMLQEFYRLRDIDEKGRPSRARLESLGMKEVADALHG